jgi:hypothetical protein
LSATAFPEADLLCELAKIVNSVELRPGKEPMPTRNENLTDELDHFVSAEIESGRYEMCESLDLTR